MLEARPRLGGRAYSFTDPETGLLIDNCQHVLLGCCEATKGFLARIGSLHEVRFRECIRFVGEGASVMDIRPSPLPAPFHLAPSLLSSHYLSLADKARLCGVMIGMAAWEAGKESCAADYLKSLGCSESLARAVFEPILIAALNEEASEASASYARMVLTTSLLGGRGDYMLGVPGAPLSEVFAEPAARCLAEHGAEVRLRAKVTGLDVEDGRVRRVRLQSGEALEVGACVLAAPPWRLPEIGFAVDAAHRLQWRPIVGVHLFFEGDRVPFEPACVVGEPFGWVFDKSADFGLRQSYAHAVASAAGDIADLRKSDLVFLALRAVARAAPELSGARLRRAVVVRERRATFSTAGGVDGVRPPAATQQANLFLAGDWTDTRWPATIESAVRSGTAAARAVMERVP